MTGAGVGWRLSEAQLRAWLGTLVGAGDRVVAPVEEDGLRLYRPISSADQAWLGPGKTRWSPKEFLFPRTEALYTYAFGRDGVRLEDPPAKDRRQVLFGVRCCDAAGLVRLDELLASRPVDPFYARRREDTIVVSLACTEAGPGCFCTAVGGSPSAAEGSDVTLVPLADAWLVHPVTSQGETLVEPSRAEWIEAKPRDRERAEELRQHVELAILRKPISRDPGARLEDGFDSPLWQRLAEHCFGCGICAYVCPSCSCFDMNHEGNAWGGAQRRSWDSCTFPLFTRHASGHNPRPSEGERYRQRVLHKFAYRPEDEDRTFRCVGCGRCIELCPAGLDIHAAVGTVLAAAGETTQSTREPR